MGKVGLPARFGAKPEEAEVRRGYISGLWLGWGVLVGGWGLGLGRGGWGLMVLQVFLSLGVWGIRGFGIQQDPSELIFYARPVGRHFCHSATVGAQICPESEL